MRGGQAMLFLLWAMIGCDRGELEAAEHGIQKALAAIDSAGAEAEPLQHEPRVVEPAGPEPPPGYRRMTAIARSGDFGNAVLLVTADETIVVPIAIGGTEALSIQLRLSGQKFTRPLTHDLFDAFAKKTGAKMLRAQVDAIDAGVYLGTVVFERPVPGKASELLTLDARPSDAIALAIGNAVPIFVSTQLIDEVGVHTGDLDPDSDDLAPKPAHNPVAL